MLGIGSGLKKAFGGGGGKSPKAPEKTAAQEVLEKRQRSMLDEEIEESEDMLKALASKRLGSKSFLAGAPATRGKAASGGGATGRAAMGGSALIGSGPSRGGASAATTTRAK